MVHVASVQAFEHVQEKIDAIDHQINEKKEAVIKICSLINQLVASKTPQKYITALEGVEERYFNKIDQLNYEKEYLTQEKEVILEEIVTDCLRLIPLITHMTLQTIRL